MWHSALYSSLRRANALGEPSKNALNYAIIKVILIPTDNSSSMNILQDHKAVRGHGTKLLLCKNIHKIYCHHVRAISTCVYILPYFMLVFCFHLRYLQSNEVPFSTHAHSSEDTSKPLNSYTVYFSSYYPSHTISSTHPSRLARSLLIDMFFAESVGWYHSLMTPWNSLIVLWYW